ncbi:B12 binding domain protein [Oxobacter pfennigii]|uniref:B12 binding domain protein n=1 Tax=Oxobacter pfennigii TaxID=36849 RepID=A0A0P8WDN1_9CLOT|nr:cobalamin B12-binding domain-containing protein [Oxobacter pfennigii]KPU46083.1 B12 binding domain protein [Oxobacter pfennigii]
MKKIIAAAIGNCVHVAGVANFLKLAEKEGYDTDFLGPAVSIENLIKAIKKQKPDIVGVSYRLTPSAVKPLLDELQRAIEDNGLLNIEWLFGGTRPVCEVAKSYSFFKEIFDGSSDDEFTICYLSGKSSDCKDTYFESSLIERINRKYPYPVLRHHFGLPSLSATIEGIKTISEAKVLDVISIAPDQNAQEHFFEMEKASSALDGAGGVPVRSPEDFIKMYEASRRGNYPLLRCYSGTSDVFRFAEMLRETINNSWAAVPLCWYNVLDGRGPRDVETSIRENQALMKWHGDRNIPVEVNESHHWSLRDAHDTIGVASAFLAAYNAKRMGVKDYIAQYMFNVPPAISPKMDLAKMLAKIEMIESLENEHFKAYRQVRSGLASFPDDLNTAKGQMAASIYLGMAVKPHIVHVVGFCEAHHAALPEDIIESASIARGVIKNCLLGLPDMSMDREVQSRKNQLIDEAQYLLKSMYQISPESKDPWCDPSVIAEAIAIGILDAPHLKGNKAAKGTLKTRMVNGCCVAYDDVKDTVISECDRIDMLFNRIDMLTK